MRNFILGLFVAGAISAQATTLDFDLRDVSNATPAVATGNSYGNSIKYTTGGVSVTVTAWALTGGVSNNSFETAYLGRYDTGLGACNQEQFCIDPGHQVDNFGAQEFLLFQFSTPVDPLSVTIDPYGTYDRDVTYYTGSTINSLNLAGKTLGQLTSLGFGSAVSDDSTVSSSARTVTLTSDPVNSVLFGARNGVRADVFSDAFKVSTISAQTVSPAPEPATIGLFGSAVLFVLKRRRGVRAAE